MQRSRPNGLARSASRHSGHSCREIFTPRLALLATWQLRFAVFGVPTRTRVPLLPAPEKGLVLVFFILFFFVRVSAGVVDAQARTAETVERIALLLRNRVTR